MVLLEVLETNYGSLRMLNIVSRIKYLMIFVFKHLYIAK